MKSNREQALEWWNSLKKEEQQSLWVHVYWTTIREDQIESIWEDETQTLTQEYIDSKLDDMMSDLIDEELDRGLVFIKPNQKQFKEVSPTLVKAYLDKFSQEGKAEILSILIKDLGVVNLVDPSLVITESKTT